ncbi:MAG: hypothetical protein Q8M59_13220 [Tabrizicola sp.]|uniref:hypothetical protein n=1 Tax=Tabrizicola sp. TaxID=2005166 RepID=UPI002734C7D8|nr:hypothetical protein [Tabrizicola sp.]MDP3263915.1 hypothetical protein [Tabrizicola sp.]MDP3647280.1 hypothetical protein [Paracoccaceae bacterium]
MSATQSGKLRRMVMNLARLGIPFEMAALMVANQMRQDDILITPENLDAAFSIYN